MSKFNKLYDEFIEYLESFITIDEFEFIKNKGIKYINDLFILYLEDKNKIENKIYCDMKNI